jgi:hypothetical protein
MTYRREDHGPLPFHPEVAKRDRGDNRKRTVADGQTLSPQALPSAPV